MVFQFGVNHFQQTKYKYCIFGQTKNAMLTKVRLKEQIDKLPEEFSIDELVEKLILIEKIETGNKQSENGEVISESEMENEIEKWFE